MFLEEFGADAERGASTSPSFGLVKSGGAAGAMDFSMAFHIALARAFQSRSKPLVLAYGFSSVNRP